MSTILWSSIAIVVVIIIIIIYFVFGNKSNEKNAADAADAADATIITLFVVPLGSSGYLISLINKFIFISYLKSIFYS